MVAREIRKNCHREMATPCPFKRKSVRTHFEGGMCSTCIPHFREHLVQVERFGSGVARLSRPLRRAIPGCADKSSGETRCVQNRIHEKSCCRLPVCSRNADKSQRICRTAIEIRRSLRERTA